MKFKVKNIKVSTGSVFVVLVDSKDALDLGVFSGDRVNISFGKKSLIALVNISKDAMVKDGEIGLYLDVTNELALKSGSIVSVYREAKPKSLVAIRKKLYGNRLSEKEIYDIVDDVANDRLTDIETTYFIAGGLASGLNLKETTYLTKAMIDTGETITFPKNKIVVDKHCIGGIAGNRTTPITVAIEAAAGYTVPKTSSRAITSPAGTADTMEVICNVSLSKEQIMKTIKKAGACLVWGGALNLAPADDNFIHVEHSLGIDSCGQLIASVLSKKGSVGSTHVLIDIPVGKDAKVRSKSYARTMASLFRKVGKSIGMKVKVITTDGSQPIGHGMGPALEAKDVLRVLQNHPLAPTDLKEKGILLAAESFEMHGVKNPKDKARKLLESGAAWKKFVEIVSAQGVKVLDPDKIRNGKYSYAFKAIKSGKIIELNNKYFSRTSSVAGAPRDIYAGIYLNKHVNDEVSKGETIFTLYSDSEDRLERAKAYFAGMEGIKIK